MAISILQKLNEHFERTVILKQRFHAGPPAWIERKFTFLLRLFKLQMSEYTLKIGVYRNLKKSPKII